MPFVLSYADDVHKQVTTEDPSFSRISGAAWTMLERSLLQQLAATANTLLMVEWRSHAGDSSPTGADSSHYQLFVDRMLAGELVSVFVKFPVLARILATVTENHLEACMEFAQRLSKDWNRLSSVFNHGHDHGMVESIRAGLSDYHCGGRSVMRLRFTSGVELIYKPRSLGIEHAFQGLLDWINSKTPASPVFRTITVFDCGTHGWMEYVTAAPPGNAGETQLYYRRMGRLLCLFHGLAGTDLHCENIVAAGEHPVIVDLETLFQPDAADKEDRATLQRTDFLPQKLAGAAGGNRIVSGLGQWDGRYGSAVDTAHVEWMAGGFEEMYRFLVNVRQELLRESGPLSAFRNHAGRFIFRATHVYAYLLRQSLEPDHLESGTAWSIELEFLLRKALLRFEDAPKWWGFLKAEVAALQLLDIPRFTARITSDGVQVQSGQRLDGYLAGSGWDRAMTALWALDEQDLAVQLNLLRTSFHPPALRTDS